MFQTLLIKPIYNLLVYITGLVPGGHIGVAIIIVTIIIKIILYPLTKKFIHTQIQMKSIQGELKEVQNKYKDDKQKLGEETMKVYKKHGVNPFSGIFLMFIQIPILWALFRVFRTSIDITQGAVPFKADLLYSFVHLPETASTMFLGLDLVDKSIVLALLVGIFQYIHMRLLTPPPEPTKKDKTPGMAEAMQKNMKIFMPAMVTFFAASFPAALALYWLSNTVFSIGQEYLVRRKDLPILASQTKNASQ